MDEISWLFKDLSDCDYDDNLSAPISRQDSWGLLLLSLFSVISSRKLGKLRLPVTGDCWVAVRYASSGNLFLMIYCRGDVGDAEDDIPIMSYRLHFEVNVRLARVKQQPVRCWWTERHVSVGSRMLAPSAQHDNENIWHWQCAYEEVKKKEDITHILWLQQCLLLLQQHQQLSVPRIETALRAASAAAAASSGGGSSSRAAAAADRRGNRTRERRKTGRVGDARNAR